MRSLFTFLLVIFTSFSFSFPQIISISEAREDLNGDYIPDRAGDTVTVMGVVFTPNFAPGLNHYYIDDGTAGIHAFAPGPHQCNWDLGDKTQITGVVTSFNGCTEIIALDSLSWELMSVGNTLPDPVPLTIGQYLSYPETYEGSLVQLMSVTMIGGLWPGPGFNSMIQVSDGIDTVDLWIDRDTDIGQFSPPQWPGDVLAVGEQNTNSVPPNDGYNLVPRFYSDFLITIGVDLVVVSAPEDFILYQNYPNPFNPKTRIKYSVPHASLVQIKVYDVIGNEIETLVDRERLSGTYELTWNAANLPSGVYFYRIQAGEFIQTKKMLLLK